MANDKRKQKETNAAMNKLLRGARGLTAEEADSTDMNALLRAARGITVEAKPDNSEEDE